MNTSYPMYPYGYPNNYGNYNPNNISYNPYNVQQQVQMSQMQSQPTQQVQPQNTVQRKFDVVQGKAAAEIYNVNAGEEIFLLDMDNPYIYRKARGFDNKLEPMETYDILLHKEDEEKKDVDLSAYITSEQMEDIISNEINERIKEEVDKRLSEISFAPTTASVKTSRKRMTKKDED